MPITWRVGLSSQGKSDLPHDRLAPESYALILAPLLGLERARHGPTVAHLFLPFFSRTLENQAKGRAQRMLATMMSTHT